MVTWTDRDDLRERYGKPQRPAVQFTRRDDVRDLMKSPAGKNYGNMMDLQSQAARQGGFDKGDPRVAELKAARRQYNRQDKYKIGELMGYDPLDVQDTYRTNSGVLRGHARPTYKEMYPISDIAHQVSGGGGLTGMLLNKAFGKSKKAGKNFFDDLRGMGGDIFGAIGIGGAVPRDEATEEILTNYADKTFGDAYPTNIHDDELLDTEDWTERENVVIPPDYPIDEGAFTSLHPFDDSRREAAIMAQYPGKAAVSPPLGSPNVHEDEPWPYQDTEVIEETTQDGNLISDELWDSIRDFDPSTLGKPGNIHAGEDIIVPPWLLDPSLPMPPELLEEEAPPSIPFDDSLREAGIATLYGQGPKWGGTNRRYEDEYTDYVERIGNMPGGPMTYEEFSEAWEGIHQGRPHAGLR